ncbi:hypothetical protein B0H11DRAFT_872044 [Mycena galericulata]|nr:hypothetical protein B0H11DRAFT_872044 [Mycena galericulata]
MPPCVLYIVHSFSAWLSCITDGCAFLHHGIEPCLGNPLSFRPPTSSRIDVLHGLLTRWKVEVFPPCRGATTDLCPLRSRHPAVDVPTHYMGTQSGIRIPSALFTHNHCPRLVNPKFSRLQSLGEYQVDSVSGGSRVRAASSRTLIRLSVRPPPSTSLPPPSVPLRRHPSGTGPHLVSPDSTSCASCSARYRSCHSRLIAVATGGSEGPKKEKETERQLRGRGPSNSAKGYPGTQVRTGRRICAPWPPPRLQRSTSCAIPGCRGLRVARECLRRIVCACAPASVVPARASARGITCSTRLRRWVSHRPSSLAALPRSGDGDGEGARVVARTRRRRRKQSWTIDDIRV